MPRRRRLSPRTDIPDWRDPQLPVTREYNLMNGKIMRDPDPEYERRFREMLMCRSPAT